MNIGKLDQRITIQFNDNKDLIVNGNEVDNWVDYYSCWAYANGLSGTEFWTASALHAENTVVFEVRYCSKIKTILSDIENVKKYRVLFNGQFYNITYIDNIQFQNIRTKIKAQVGTWQN